jgi:hypothetical protein
MRVASHSRGQFSSRKQTNQRFIGYKNTILATLQRIPSMPDDELKEYTRRINSHYKRLIAKNNLYYFLQPIHPMVQRVKKLFVK